MIMNYNNIDYIEKNDPATKEDIEYVEKHINETIPKVYKEFLRYANGIALNVSAKLNGVAKKNA